MIVKAMHNPEIRPQWIDSIISVENISEKYKK